MNTFVSIFGSIFLILFCVFVYIFKIKPIINTLKDYVKDDEEYKEESEVNNG